MKRKHVTNNQLSHTHCWVTYGSEGWQESPAARFHWDFELCAYWHTACSIGAQSSKVTHPRSESGGEPNLPPRRSIGEAHPTNAPGEGHKPSPRLAFLVLVFGARLWSVPDVLSDMRLFNPRRPLNAVDDQNRNGAALGLELEAKLFLHGSEERREFRSPAGGRRRPIGRELQIEIKFTAESRAIDDTLRYHLAGQPHGQSIHRHARAGHPPHF